MILSQMPPTIILATLRSSFAQNVKRTLDYNYAILDFNYKTHIYPEINIKYP